MRRFQTWGVEGRVIPQCQDATCLTFPGEKFAAVFSVDAYHYFAGEEGFFEEKILPFVRPGGCVLIAVPGIRQELEGRQTALLTPWLGEEAYMFRSGERWRELLGESEEIAAREVWEMENFSPAWDSWLGTDNPHAEGDRAFFESVIRPYTCFIGMAVKKKG